MARGRDRPRDHQLRRLWKVATNVVANSEGLFLCQLSVPATVRLSASPPRTRR